MMEKESSLAVKAYETIRQQIFDFDLFPGQIVSDYLLSKDLNMSRTPIRQALMRLENEGLLEEQSGKKNYRISTITTEDIQDLFDFREGIETTAFMLAWRRGITPDQLKALQDITNNMKSTNEAGQAKEHFFYDQQFHNELVALSNNKRLVKAHDEILLQLTRMRFLSFLENSLQSKACVKHQAILDAIRDQDYEKGRQAVIDHVRSSKEDYINLFGNGLSSNSLCLLRYFTRTPKEEPEEGTSNGTEGGTGP